LYFLQFSNLPAGLDLRKDLDEKFQKIALLQDSNKGKISINSIIDELETSIDQLSSDINTRANDLLLVRYKKLTPLINELNNLTQKVNVNSLLDTFYERIQHSITFTVDGTEVHGQPGQTILDAASAAGIYVTDLDGTLLDPTAWSRPVRLALVPAMLIGRLALYPALVALGTASTGVRDRLRLKRRWVGRNSEGDQ